MLEKIGLPTKPSLRGNNWVVDASHCQGCSSQFTFINRKHHCRRCGGLFCNSCTQHRMVLRGQGDSPVRICEPCKKLEEAARFEMRYGHRNRAGRGSSKAISKDEDEVLSQILGNNDMGSSIQRASSSSSYSTAQDFATSDEGAEVHRSGSVDGPNLVNSEVGSTSPQELRQQALDEKKRYKILKAEGKSVEALSAFKRGKELERQADALEISLRKNRRKALTSGNAAEIQNRDGSTESSRKGKLSTQVGKEKDDLFAELKELGWSDMDLHDEDKKPANMTLEGELSSLLGGISQGTNKGMGTGGIDKTQVVAHKRRALTLKREGKLAEAKEELKKAKVLEKQLEEKELLGVDDDSDDEISALIRSIDNDNQDKLLVGYEHQHDLDFNHFMGTVDDQGLDSNLEVTDEDLVDPEIAATLKSLGWTDDSDSLEKIGVQTVNIDKEALQHEILSLKSKALDKKRAGNVPEAMALLKKAKLLEKDLEGFKDEADNLVGHNLTVSDRFSTSQSINPKHDKDSRLAPKSRFMIQKELLSLKKRALTLRREGKLDEAEEELKKGKVLEQQLEEMDNTSKMKGKQVNVANKDSDLAYGLDDISEDPPIGEGDEKVTAQDMHDPTYLALLRNLGWKDEDNGLENLPSNFSKENDYHTMQDAKPNIPARKRSKAEIQRELLGLKRKALALRHEGKSDEGEELLRSAKELEAEMVEIEVPKKEIQDESEKPRGEISGPPLESAMAEGNAEDVTEKDMQDPTYISLLRSLGWKDNVDGLANTPSKFSKEHDDHTMQNTKSNISARTSGRSKVEIQRELLGLKRKALTLRREGKSDEAEQVLTLAKELEAQIAEMEAPKKEIYDESKRPKDEIDKPLLKSAIVEGDVENISEKDTCEPAVPSLLENIQWKDEKPELVTKDKVNFGYDVSSLSQPVVHVGSLKEDITTETKDSVGQEKVNADKNGQSNKDSGRQEVLARKKKALSLKREGKLAEAREELRQAKLLERSLEEETPEPETGTHEIAKSVSNATLIQEKESGVSNLGRKPLSGRDRFKLQQESLSHKRQALKLRREGRMNEAEAEFELAKSLEAQLEEFASQDSTNATEPADDVVVEDLLDPQLLATLKDIGVVDVSIMSQVPEKPRPMKVSPVKNETISQERTQLEERIKAEKLKAVNLKRSGKQSEALDALRRAKLFEKKLDSLASS